MNRLMAALKVAQLNAPLEREAQRIANARVKAKVQANNITDKDEISKIRRAAISDARNSTGASGKRTRIIGISVTLPAANWSGGAQTVAHASLLADSNYIYLVGADAGTRNVYDSYGVSADNVTTSGQMTFRCDTTPTVDLSVFIIRLEVGTDE